MIEKFERRASDTSPPPAKKSRAGGFDRHRWTSGATSLLTADPAQADEGLARDSVLASTAALAFAAIPDRQERNRSAHPCAKTNLAVQNGLWQ